MQRLAENRQATGRFTLEEAAAAVVQGVENPANVDIILMHWERDWPLLCKLIQSARTGELPIYSPEGLTIPPDEAPTFLWFTRETTWDDLNTWLAKHEPNVSFRFCPSAATAAMAAEVSPEIETEQDKYLGDTTLGLEVWECHICPPTATATMAASASPETETEQDEYPDDSTLGLGMRERQIRRIEWAAKYHGYDPTAIPDGGKAKLREFCEKKFPRFLISKNAFNKAWEVAIGQKGGRVRLRMKEHEKFAAKGT